MQTHPDVVAAYIAHRACQVSHSTISRDVAAIAAGLDAIAADYARTGPPDDPALEDIHMATEARLAERIGPVAGRLHTALRDAILSGELAAGSPVDEIGVAQAHGVSRTPVRSALQADGPAAAAGELESSGTVSASGSSTSRPPAARAERTRTASASATTPHWPLPRR